MSNDKEQKHVNVISVSAWDDPADVLLQKIKGRLAELESLTDLLAKKMEAEKPRPAQPTPVKLQATAPYGFLLPAFNGASGADQARALPTDMYKIVDPGQLSDFRTVLQALADPATHDSNRNAIFPPSGDKPSTGVTAAFQYVTDITAGKSSFGFNITVLTASHGLNPAHLYVVEDKHRDKMMIAGPTDIPSILKAALQRRGISYVCQKDPECASSVNNFLAEGAKWRGERGMLIIGNTQNVIESLLNALDRYCPVNWGQPSAARGMTLGKAISEAPKPFRSVQITMP